jgi:ATP-dependent Clp protease ATP-binding subunit ClpB
LFMFGSEDAIVRIDMSEYMEKHSVSKLIGAPPGYVGYEEGGQLTEAVRRRPYSVVLLDELEKAHADVSNILLQLLDDGRLSDSQGRTVSFKNVVVIMTSNLGSSGIFEAGGDKEQARAAALSAMRQNLKPEVINRIDDVIVFDPLDRKQIRTIVKLQVARVAQRLAAKKVRLELTEAAIDHLAAVGYDPVYGARPVKRAIQRELENPLAKALLRGDFGAGLPGGDEELELDAGEGEAADAALAKAQASGEEEDELVVVDGPQPGREHEGLVLRSSHAGAKKQPAGAAAA